MKLSLRSLFAAAGLFVASSGIGQAEEINLKPTFDPFAAPEITLVGHCTDGCADAYAGGCTDSCNSCCTSRHVGRDFFVCKDRCGGLIGGAELLFLRPFGSEDVFDQNGSAQMNYNPAARLWIGTQNADGLGARIRYFEFDRVSTAAGGNNVGVEAKLLDLEATQAVNFRRFNMEFFGGLRYAENRIAVPNVSTGFNGVGLTFGAQVARDLNQSGSLRLASGARWSAVYGNSLIAGGNDSLQSRDDLKNILELNIGPQYRRQLANGGYLTLGGGLEAQVWNGGFNADTQDFGFAGFATSVSITR